MRAGDLEQLVAHHRGDHESAPSPACPDCEAVDAPQPCYDCSCCTLWAQSLQLLRDHIARHVRSEVRLKPCHPDCLVCGEISWQG